MIKAIIFDYDGVIVDSFQSLHEVYKIICKELGKKCHEDIKEFQKLYGYTSKELKKNLGISEDEDKKANIIYNREIIKKDHTTFDGIKEVINELKKDYNLILISASPRKEVMHKLEKYNLSDKFDLVFASDNLGPMRKVKAIAEAFKKMNLKSDEVIMIGDRTVDYNEGIKAGLKSNHIILVEYGWGYDKDKIKQKFLVKKPSDLIEAVKIIDKNARTNPN